jgi:hypothetical protein
MIYFCVCFVLYDVGTFASARFSTVGAFTFNDDESLLFVANINSKTIVQLNFTNHYVTTLAGTTVAGTQYQAVGTNALISQVQSLFYYSATDSLYMADYGAHNIRTLDLSTKTVTVIAGNYTGVKGTSDGIGINAYCYSPNALVLIDNLLYVSETEMHRIRIVNITDLQVSFGYGSGGFTTVTDGTGIGVNAHLGYNLQSVSMPSTVNEQYVYANAVGRIIQIDTKTRSYSLAAGSGSCGVSSSNNTCGTFAQLCGVEMTFNNHLDLMYFTDSSNNVVRTFNRR